jgi:fructokinase
MTETQARYALAFGELLWDILPSGPVLGGAPGNFCFRLTELGVPAYLVSRVGNDQLGSEALSEISQAGVNSDFIQTDSAHPTGTVPVELDPTGTPSFTILPDVAYDYIALTPALQDAASKAALLYFGTLAQRAPVSRETVLSLIESAQSALKFFDINLRKDSYSPEVIDRSLSLASVAKLNHEELATLTKMFGISGGSIDSQAEALLERYRLEVLVVTMAERGAYALSSVGERRYVPGYAVKVVDTIGSGDAFSAGFCSVLLQRGTLSEACELGNRLGALVAQSKGAMTSLSDAERNRVGRDMPRVSEASLENYA